MILQMRSRGGFTLLEVMIVVILIAVLLAVAIPNWVRAHEVSSKRSCISNLRQIEQAKERIAIEGRKPNGDSVAWSDLIPAYLKQQPECPSSGEYTLEAVGDDPICSVPGHQLR